MGQPTIVELEDIYGNFWPLAGPNAGDEGVILEASEVIDVFDEADVKTFRDEGAFQVGSRYRGKRILARYPVFDVLIADTASSSWRDVFSRWRRGWSYDTDCKLWIEDEDSRRYIELRKNGKIRYTPDSDHNQAEVCSVEMNCVAGNPWFREQDGPSNTDTFVTTTDTTSSGTETGYVNFGGNPTDSDSWLVWTVQGAAGIRWTIPDFSYGSDEFDRATADASRAIVMPALLAGEHLVIDTDKLAESGQVNSSLDTEVYMRMGGVRFMYRVPPHTPAAEIPVSVTGAPIGAGIQVRAPRNWWSATGGQA